MLLHGMDSTETSVVQAATDILLVRKHGHAAGWYSSVSHRVLYDSAVSKRTNDVELPPTSALHVR